MAYIHQLQGWPEFTWDGDKLAAPLAEVRHRQGRLLGAMDGLGFDVRTETNLSVLTVDIVKTSQIEGEALNAEEVRSSVARRLGLDVGGVSKASRSVEGIVEMMLDATRNAGESLTRERLFAWHAALFPTGHSGMQPITVAEWRTAEAGPMQVVSGPFGRQRVHFEAPAAERLAAEMTAFLDWFNTPASDDPVLRAGIAHLWFVTIHPFEDGNGRIARAIADLSLSRADGTPDRFYSMSAQLEADRKSYYQNLERAQRGDLDITGWLSWFLDCLDRALARAQGDLEAVLRKARLWQRINVRGVNERQRLVINRLLNGFEGFLTTSKYAKLAKVSNDTALRDIRELADRGVLLQNPARGRSTSYRLADPENVAT